MKNNPTLDDGLDHLLSLLAFNQVECYQLELQLAEKLKGYDDEHIKLVADALVGRVKNLTLNSGIPVEDIMRLRR